MVSLFFAGISLGVIFSTLGQGRNLETTLTMVVNTLVVLGIFCLFSVRYLHMTSFTYLPVMNAIFGLSPLTLADGALILAIGATSFVRLEIKKHFLRDRFQAE